MSHAVQLHVDVQGEGRPAVVLMHGFAGSARNFRPQVRALRDRHRVVTFDARGHARSPAPEQPEAYGRDVLVEDARGVIEEHGDGRVVLGGVSMGAGIALEYALRYPGSLAGLVLCSFPAPGVASTWATDFADAIESVGLEEAGARYVWGDTSRFDADAARLIRLGFVEHRPHALVAILRRVLAVQPSIDDLAPEVRALSIPTLLVAGDRDATAVVQTRALATLLPRATVVIVPGAGHLVNLEKSESFNEAVRGFSSRIEGG